MRLNQIRDVLVIVEQGSLRRAARQLGTTQPALTRSIRELERELGATLFERRPNGMALTGIGHAFVRRGSLIQHEVERVRSEVEQLKGHHAGVISIGLSPASHLALLARVIGPFQERYPGVRVHIAEGLFPWLERDLRDGSIDFYVGPLAGNDRPYEMLVEPLFTNHRLVFGRHGHPLAGATSLAQLVGARWVTDALTLPRHDELEPMFAQYGLPEPYIAVSGQTSLSTIITAARSDLLAMLPQQWAPVLAASGLIVPIPIRETLNAAAICIVRRAEPPLTPVAGELEDLFRRAAADYALALPGSPLAAG